MVAPFGEQFPGLALGQDQALTDPELARALGLFGSARIGLVPAARPADVLAVVGYDGQRSRMSGRSRSASWTFPSGRCGWTSHFRGAQSGWPVTQPCGELTERSWKAAFFELVDPVAESGGALPAALTSGRFRCSSLRSGLQRRRPARGRAGALSRSVSASLRTWSP